MTDDNLTVDDADKALFGAAGQRETVVEKINISLIHADIVQPRRTIPAAIRGTWLGSPARVPSMLRKWRTAAEESIGEMIDVTLLVRGNSVAADNVRKDVVAGGFVELCELAATIFHDGLVNPITVARVPGGTYLIETGERRWLAHFLLAEYAENRFDMIAAKIVDKSDIHRQSSENAARRGLNAVEMARQLAVLIMDMYGAEQFEPYNVCVEPGGCDRNYYVQAVNRDIIRGQGPRLMAESGIKNKTMVSNYRNILTLPDDLWMQADEENWAESRCRDVLAEIRAAADLEKERETAWIAALAEDEGQTATPQGDVLPIGDISQEIMSGYRVLTQSGQSGVVDSITFDGDWASVWIDGDDHTTDYSLESLSKVVAVQVGDNVVTAKGIGIITSSMPSIKGHGKKAYWIKLDDGSNTFICQSDDILAVLAEFDDDGTPPINDILPEFLPGDRVETPDGIGELIVRSFVDDDESKPVTGAYVRLDSGKGISYPIDDLVWVSRNTVVEPDVTDDAEHDFKLGDVVNVLHGAGTVVEISDYGDCLFVRIPGENENRKYYPGIDKLALKHRPIDLGGDDAVAGDLTVDDVFFEGDIVNTPDGIGKIIEISLHPAANDYVVLLEKGGRQRYNHNEISHVDKSYHDINQEIGQKYVEPYVPESHEDAIPAVNLARPELGRLIAALADYYEHCDEIGDAEFAFAFEDLMASDNAVLAEIAGGDDIFRKYKKDMNSTKKNMRAYLEQIAGHIDEWAGALVDIASVFDLKIWTHDDD